MEFAKSQPHAAYAVYTRSTQVQLLKQNNSQHLFFLTAT